MLAPDEQPAERPLGLVRVDGTLKATLKGAALLAVALGGGIPFLVFVHQIYPIRQWLFWTVLNLWAWQSLLITAMLALGNLFLKRISGFADLPRVTRITLAATVGAIVFALGLVAASIVGCLNPWFAVLWPTAMLVAGLVGGRASLRAMCLAYRWGARQRSLAGTLAVAFGTLGLAVLYLGLFSPDAVSYDAAWTHLVIAQDYARERRMVPFPADWPKNLAHFSSVINTWAFLVPGLGPPPVRWMMALHTEFSFFVLTLVGVTAAVEWALGAAAPASWAVMFLLPGIFAYDSNMGGGADHFAAFFVAPAMLAAVHAAQTMNRRWWILFGVVAGAAITTRYQSFYFLVPMGGLLAGALLARAVAKHLRSPPWLHRRIAVADLSSLPPVNRRARPQGTLLALPVSACLAAAAVGGHHFLRNWVYYGNPLYPFAQRWFTGSRPCLPDAASIAENLISHFGSRPPAEWGPRLAQAARLVFDFSFFPHAGFTGQVPVFGSLFTLCLPLLLFLPDARRIRLVVGLALAALFCWACTWRVDRNLQIFTPLLAIATAAIVTRAWHSGRLARLAVGLLVGLQLVWSGDHFFLGSDRMASAINLIRSGFDGRAATRFDGYAADRIALGRTLPRDATVLLHNLHVNLGIDRRVLLDSLGDQALIDPRTFRSPRDLFERYRAVGVTHIVFHPNWYPATTKQGEVLFAAFTDHYRPEWAVFGDLRLMALPSEPPPVEPDPYTVMLVGVAGYADGIYEVTELSTLDAMPAHLQRHLPPRLPVAIADAPSHLPTVRAVLLGTANSIPRDNEVLTANFHLASDYPELSVWLNSSPAEGQPTTPGPAQAR